MYILLNLLYFQSMSSVYIFTFVSVFCLNEKQSDRISVPPDYIKYVLLYEHAMNLLKKTND